MKQLRLFWIVSLFSLVLTFTVAASPGTPAQQQNSNSSSANASQMTPEMDGGAGPCSLLLTVSHEGKPAVAAHVKVHIAYGFGGIRKLDLDAYTGNDGKLKFTGLPARVKRPPLELHASKDKLVGTTTYDPESECHEKLDIVLSPQKTEE
jgi:hypothetical protein